MHKGETGKKNKQDQRYKHNKRLGDAHKKKKKDEKGSDETYVDAPQHTNKDNITDKAV